MMKKIIIFTIIFSLLTVNIVPLTEVNAKTLKDYKNELAKLESESAANKRVTANTKAKINQKRNAIITANNTITSNETKVENSKIKVAESEEQIKLKNKDMENTIELVQYTRNGSNDIYFDYILNSSTTTELMTRQSRIQQIASHTQEELIELEKLIDENKELQIQLEKDNVTLTNSISE